MAYLEEVVSSSLTGPTILDVFAEAVASKFPHHTIVTERMVTVTLPMGKMLDYGYDIHCKGEQVSVYYTKIAFGVTEGTIVLNRWDLSDPNVNPDDILEFFLQTINDRFRSTI